MSLALGWILPKAYQLGVHAVRTVLLDLLIEITQFWFHGLVAPAVTLFNPVQPCGAKDSKPIFVKRDFSLLCNENLFSPKMDL